MSVLDELVAGAVEDQRAREQNISLDEVKRQTFEAPAPIDARQWLKKADGIPVIAEIKRLRHRKGSLATFLILPHWPGNTKKEVPARFPC